MTFHHAQLDDEAQGQAAFGTANLRSNRTGLPFVVCISQKDATRHDVRVKVAASPKVRSQEMGSYALRPLRHVGGHKLAPDEERLLQAWIENNIDILVDYWNGNIEYTEDAIGSIRPI